jgi:hypothetical protein
VIDSLLTDGYRVATPVNWKPPYMRLTPQPNK